MACLLANLSQGQKKSDVEISTTQSEAAHLLNVFRKAAAKLNVSIDLVQFAKKVLEQGAAELVTVQCSAPYRSF